MRSSIVLILYSSIAYSSIGFDACLQKPFNAVGNWPAITLSFVATAPKPPLYFSSGIILRPGPVQGVEKNGSYVSKIRKTHSFYGLCAGTHFALAPVFRPGIIAGFSFKKEEIFAVINDVRQRIDYSPYALNPYFAFTIHAFFPIYYC